MAIETRRLDVYWTIQNGQRFTVSLSEEGARAALHQVWEYEQDSSGWSIERIRETVPVARGKLAEGQGEMVELDDNGAEVSRKFYAPVHVFWDCPHCGQQHNVNMHADPIQRTTVAANPSIWCCEQGEGIVLVHW